MIEFGDGVEIEEVFRVRFAWRTSRASVSSSEGSSPDKAGSTSILQPSSSLLSYGELFGKAVQSLRSHIAVELYVTARERCDVPLNVEHACGRLNVLVSVVGKERCVIGRCAQRTGRQFGDAGEAKDVGESSN